MDVKEHQRWWRIRGRREMRALAMEHWDPIGVRGEPGVEDEYDSYLAQVGALLRGGAGASAIADSLTSAERQMGLATSREALLGIAIRFEQCYAMEMLRLANDTGALAHSELAAGDAALLSQLRDGDFDRVAFEDDEHERFRIYKTTVEALSGREELIGTWDLLDVFGRDPIPALGESATILLVDRFARFALGGDDFAEQTALMAARVNHFVFATARIAEWQIFWAVLEARSVDDADVLDGSDWLQRRLVTVDSRSVLELLAGSGRTRRVRNAAARRLTA